MIVQRFFLALALVLLLAASAHAGEIRGRVVGVVDGDTVTVLDDAKRQHKIRLVGIDAPEKSQAYGQHSKKSLSDLVFGHTVTVITTKRDRYGRAIGKILLHNLDVNLEQVRRGLAWFYRQYANELTAQDRHIYADAERSAQRARLGLWSDPNAQAPWQYRRHTK